MRSRCGSGHLPPTGENCYYFLPEQLSAVINTTAALYNFLVFNGSNYFVHFFGHGAHDS